MRGLRSFWIHSNIWSFICFPISDRQFEYTTSKNTLLSSQYAHSLHTLVQSIPEFSSCKSRVALSRSTNTSRLKRGCFVTNITTKHSTVFVTIEQIDKVCSPDIILNSSVKKDEKSTVHLQSFTWEIVFLMHIYFFPNLFFRMLTVVCSFLFSLKRDGTKIFVRSKCFLSK